MNITRTSRAPEAYNVTEALTVRHSRPWKGTATRNGECLSIMPDGTTRVMAATRTRKSNPRTKVIANPGMTYGERLAKFGATNNGNADA